MVTDLINQEYFFSSFSIKNALFYDELQLQNLSSGSAVRQVLILIADPTGAVSAKILVVFAPKKRR